MTDPSELNTPGWRFRIEEVSYGHYVVEGVHTRGPKVSRSGSDLDELLAACRKDAEDVEAALASKER